MDICLYLTFNLHSLNFYTENESMLRRKLSKILTVSTNVLTIQAQSLEDGIQVTMHVQNRWQSVEGQAGGKAELKPAEDPMCM